MYIVQLERGSKSVRVCMERESKGVCVCMKRGTESVCVCMERCLCLGFSECQYAFKGEEA